MSYLFMTEDICLKCNGGAQDYINGEWINCADCYGRGYQESREMDPEEIAVHLLERIEALENIIKGSQGA